MGIAQRIAGAIGTLALAVLLFASGFFTCAAPPATALLANAFSAENAATTFSHANVVGVANATRDYSFGNHDKQVLLQAIYDANVDAAARRASAGLAAAKNAPDLADVNRDDTAAIEQAFASASDVYVYDADMISHLDDCYSLAQTGYVVVGGVFVVCLACLIAVGVRAKSRGVGRVLIVAGSIVIALFAIAGIWAAVDFYSLFRTFHQVFFAQVGNWTFSADSLLICALPESFWMGMGAVWLVTSIIASILSILIGSWLVRRARRRAKASPEASMNQPITKEEPAL